MPHTFYGTLKEAREAQVGDILWELGERVRVTYKEPTTRGYVLVEPIGLLEKLYYWLRDTWVQGGGL